MLIGKKKLKMPKKALCLIFAFLFSINSFAAVVSDNDGAAFVTKAEFEALKDNFAEQINNYNTSIDSKIDGAISAYLAGKLLAKPITYEVINKNWGEVTFINGSYKNEYKIPDLNYLFGFNGESYRPNTTTTPDDIRAFDSNFHFNFKRGTGISNRKNCMNVLAGSEGAPTKIAWRGIATGYREIITHTCQIGELCDQSYSAFSWPDTEFAKRVMMGYPLKCQNPSYNLSPTTKIFDTSVTPQGKLVTGGGGDWYNARGAGTVYSNWLHRLTKLNIELDTINGKQFDTEHIIGWAKDTTWELYCPNWVNTWQLSPNQTINDLTVYNNVTKTTAGWYAGQEMFNTDHRNAGGAMPFTFQNSTNTTSNYFYSVGLYNTPVKNENIYQNTKDIQYTSNITYDVPNLTIEKGLPILAGKESDLVDFKPYIKSIKCYNESDVYVTNANEVDIYLSYVPFTEKNTTTDPVKFKQSDGSEKNYITTSGRIGKINFEMNKTGVVYMQLMPHFETSATIGPNKSWEIVLDLTGDNGNYILTSETS